MAQVHECDGVFNEDESEFLGFKLADGRMSRVYDGCDWKEHPTKVLVKLTKQVKRGEELLELFDGSDTLWFGIFKKKAAKK